MTFAETYTAPEREALTNRITLLTAAAEVMQDKPYGSKLYMDCPICGGTSAAGKTKRGDIIARCYHCGAATWEV